ncbi:MAG: hypothetical protein OXB87_00125 [Hyphomicrobiales bacterium]|nr:hypothetical protein [Hyphomicrobiales bacterium]
MIQNEVKYGDYKLSDGRVVHARYICARHPKKGLYWRAHPQDDDLIFVINEGGRPKRKDWRRKNPTNDYRRNPYIIYPNYDGQTVAEVKPALEEDAARADIEDTVTRAREDLEWDGGSLTGIEGKRPLRDGRRWVKISLFGKCTRTYLVIGKLV